MKFQEVLAQFDPGMVPRDGAVVDLLEDAGFFEHLTEAFTGLTSEIAKAKGVSSELKDSVRQERQSAIMTSALANFDAALAKAMKAPQGVVDKAQESVRQAVTPEEPETEMGRLMQLMRDNMVQNALLAIPEADRRKAVLSAGSEGRADVISSLERAPLPFVDRETVKLAGKRLETSLARAELNGLKVAEAVQDAASSSAFMARKAAGRLVQDAGVALPKAEYRLPALERAKAVNAENRTARQAVEKLFAANES